MSTHEWISTASSLVSLAANLVLLWQLRLYIGKQLSQGAKKVEEKL